MTQSSSRSPAGRTWVCSSHSNWKKEKKNKKNNKKKHNGKCIQQHVSKQAEQPYFHSKTQSANLRYETTNEFLNVEYVRELKRFIPLKPWQGGPPQSISTSPFCGSFCPRELFFSPDITSFNRTLQSSVKTVVPGLFNLNA